MSLKHNGKGSQETCGEGEARARFQARLLDALGQAVIATDLQGKVIYWNRAAEELYGWSQEEAKGRPITELTPSEEMLGRAEDIMSGLLAGRSWSGEFEVRRKDGTTFPVMVTDTPVHDEQGNLVAILGVSTDITERKNAEEALRRSEERSTSSFRDAAIGMALVGTDGSWMQVNRSLCEMLGYPEEELLEKAFQDLTHPDDLEADLDHVHRMLTGEIETYQMQKRYYHADGHLVWILLSASMVHDEEGEPLYFVSQIQDITERKEAEEKIREAEERYRTLVERIPVITYIQELSSSGRTTYISPQYESIKGYPIEEVLSEPNHWVKILHPDDRKWVLAEDERTDRTGEPFVAEYRQIAADGSVVWVRDEATLVHNEEGEPLYWLGIQANMTERKALEKRLEHQALHDSLTDLPNRSLFMDRLAHALERTGRKTGSRTAVLFMDLNNFKNVNDSLGHEVGDLLLVAVAERLIGCLRPEDTFARFGGDEFVVLMEDVGDPDDAVRVAERISERFQSPFRLDGRELYARASIGIATGDARTNSPEDLLRDADTAMYRAKEEGGGYEAFDPAMHERAVKRLALENDLRRAVERGEFVVHYQPIVRLDDRSVWGVEALARWEHPERGLLNPDEFVPVAEESGLVVPMGLAVLEEACRRAKGWQEAYPKLPPLVVYVNLSARQIARPDLAEAVGGALWRTGFDGSCLGLDVTERAYVKALEGNLRELDRLRDLGVRVSIDDFGTGYSSLSYLKRLHADDLKVDKSFVRGIGEDAEDTAIVQTVVELAHTLGLEAIAEGVETEEQAALLTGMGCDKAQGYHFSRPLPPEDVPGFLGG